MFFATGNKGKAEEAQKILNHPIEIVTLELDELQSMDLEKIVEHKVRQAYEIVKEPVFVDDVALYLDIWDGFPGPFVKFIHEKGNKRLLYMLRNEDNRDGLLVATIGYYDGDSVHFFKGELKVTISREEQGEGGWGLDPILIPEGKNRTFGEISEDEKNADSHRSRALLKFKKFLDSNAGSSEV